MGILHKFFSDCVDNLYYLQANKKTCNIFLKDELFDGNKYTIDEFYEKNKFYYDRPGEFYKEFSYPGSLNLDDGFHFNALDKHHAEKYPYLPYVFDSPVKTKWEETNLVPFRWFCNKERKSRILLLFSSGWARPNLNLEKFFCAYLQKNGIDAGLMSVPYHQERAPQGSYSGEYFISSNVFWTATNFRHYVAEIRLLIQYMRNQYDYIGIIGMSCGGFSAGIAVNVEKVDFYFPLITGAQLGSIIWESKITSFVKRDLIKKGIDQTNANKVLAIGDQLFLGRNSKAHYIKQYISLYDKIVPTKYQYLLWEVYNKPEKLELECGHISIAFFMKKVADDITDYVKKRINPVSKIQWSQQKR